MLIFLVNEVGNGESIAVILKRFDALSPAALENSSKANIPSNTYSMQTVVRYRPDFTAIHQSR